MDRLRAPDAPPDLPLPRQRAAVPVDDDSVQAVERLVAQIADLVLKVSALADRYDRQPAPASGRTEAADRVSRLRGAAARGRLRLQELLAAT